MITSTHLHKQIHHQRVHHCKCRCMIQQYLHKLHWHHSYVKKHHIHQHLELKINMICNRYTVINVTLASIIIIHRFVDEKTVQDNSKWLYAKYHQISLKISKYTEMSTLNNIFYRILDLVLLTLLTSFIGVS